MSSIGFMGLRAIGDGTGALYSALVVALVGIATVFFAIRREADALGIVAFLAVADPLLRSNARWLPFLALTYAALGWAMIVIYNRGRSLRLTIPLIGYGLYAVLEVVGMQFESSGKTVRGVLAPSLAVVGFLIVGHCIQLDQNGVRRVVMGILTGGLGLIGHLGYLYVSGGSAQWGGKSSNFEASGGAGPVQMSFVLAVASFMAFWCAERSRTWPLRTIYGCLCLVLLLFMLLTFSRGGIYMFAGASLVYIFCLKRPSLRTLVLCVASIAVIVAAGYTVAYITEGAFQQRYSEVKTTRVDLVSIGWQIFRDSLPFGVGTGGYYQAVEPYFGVQSGAHNEVIRAAAEHGVPGLVLWLSFYLGSLGHTIMAQRGVTRALHLALLGIFLASVFHNGLKLLMQPLLILLSFATFPQDLGVGKSPTYSARRFRHGRNLLQPKGPSEKSEK